MNNQLLRLISQVRYRELPHLIGRKIVIQSFEAIAPEVISAVAPDIPGCGAVELRPDNLRGMLAKYKMLDLTFATAAHVLTPEDKVSRTVLASLGFVPARGESQATQDVDDGDKDPTCLEELTEGTKAGHEWLKVFLDMWPPRNALAEYQAATQTAREAGAESPMEAGFLDLMRQADALFPCEFQIRDACITNSDFVWLCKHFYL